jgi:hypothetical protein
LAAIEGDLIEILTSGAGEHLLTFNNRTAGSDLPVNVALLVARTPGGAGFRGEEDGGTFRYFVVHGDGSSVTPVRTIGISSVGMRLRRRKLRLPIQIQLRHLHRSRHHRLSRRRHLRPDRHPQHSPPATVCHYHLNLHRDGFRG